MDTLNLIRKTIANKKSYTKHYIHTFYTEDITGDEHLLYQDFTSVVFNINITKKTIDYYNISTPYLLPIIYKTLYILNMKNIYVFDTHRFNHPKERFKIIQTSITDPNCYTIIKSKYGKHPTITYYTTTIVYRKNSFTGLQNKSNKKIYIFNTSSRKRKLVVGHYEHNKNKPILIHYLSHKPIEATFMGTVERINQIHSLIKLIKSK